MGGPEHDPPAAGRSNRNVASDRPADPWPPRPRRDGSGRYVHQPSPARNLSRLKVGVLIILAIPLAGELQFVVSHGIDLLGVWFCLIFGAAMSMFRSPVGIGDVAYAVKTSAAKLGKRSDEETDVLLQQIRRRQRLKTALYWLATLATVGAVVLFVFAVTSDPIRVVADAEGARTGDSGTLIRHGWLLAAPLVGSMGLLVRCGDVLWSTKMTRQPESHHQDIESTTACSAPSNEPHQVDIDRWSSMILTALAVVVLIGLAAIHLLYLGGFDLTLRQLGCLIVIVFALTVTSPLMSRNGTAAVIDAIVSETPTNPQPRKGVPPRLISSAERHAFQAVGAFRLGAFLSAVAIFVFLTNLISDPTRATADAAHHRGWMVVVTLISVAGLLARLFALMASTKQT